jgi:hypothetical protein
MFKDIRVLTCVILILVILQSTGCTGNTTSVQIGGTNNSVDQNRRSPTTQTEVTISQPSPQVSEQRVEEQNEKQDEEQQIAELQKLADEQRIALERAEEERREAERQHAEQLRLEREYYAEQSRRAQEQYALEQARRTEEQRLADVQHRRQIEEQQLAEIRRQAATPVRPNSTGPPRVIAVNSSSPSVRIQSSYTSVNGSMNIENSRKKGLSTKKKILIGTAIAGGTALGFWLGRRSK